MASQTSQFVFSTKSKIEIEHAMDQPTLTNENQPSAIRKETIKSLLSSALQKSAQRTLLSDISQENTHVEQNQSSFLDLSLEEPNNENTIIALIAMGESRNHRLAERVFWSIRAAGLFTGHIMLFTDEHGVGGYQHQLSCDPKVLVVQGRGEDMAPTTEKGIPIRMRTAMIYQRFKTLIPKYASFYPEISFSWEYALYLDIDNVVTQDLSRLFHDYYIKILEDLERSKKTSSNGNSSHSFISFWKEKKHYQGGQFITHRRFGKGCLDAWRSEFDKGKSRKDQPLLMNVHDDFVNYKCRIYTLPFGNYDRDQKGKHFNLFTSNVYNKAPGQYPTIVHMTGLRTSLNSEFSQLDFLRKALRLENVTDAIIFGNITWEEVITPVGPKGQKPKREEVQKKFESVDILDKESQNDVEANKGGRDASTVSVRQENESDVEAEGRGPGGNKKEESTDIDNDTDTKYLENINRTLSVELDLSNLTVVLPTENNTVIALVAMGKAATASYIAERCIRSIRAGGRFTGDIILFTDGDGYEKKRQTLAFDSKVILIQGKDEDMKPTSADGTRIKYAGPGHMIFKRFKTLVLEYLGDDSRFDDVRYALYLDVDNVVANPLSQLFDDYAVSMSRTLSHQNSTNFGYFSLWRDPGMGRKFWQGGQIMYDRYRSAGCVNAWRNEMDTVYHPQDQPLLLNVDNNFTKYTCRVFELPNQKPTFCPAQQEDCQGLVFFVSNSCAHYWSTNQKIQESYGGTKGVSEKSSAHQ
jgi:hypothetical protein